MTSLRSVPTLLVGQSGGPTPVINASLAGLLDDQGVVPWTRVLGLRHGIEGALKEDVIDLTGTTPADRDALSATPAAALGSCRHKLSPTEDAVVLDLFDRLGVRWFAYCGGNDSMDTLARLERAAQDRGQELHVYGVPKTIDNDLEGTNWCPGYGSAARYWATVTPEITFDLASMQTYDRVAVLEAMGRNAGWLAASSALYRSDVRDGPHILLVPEQPFVEAEFISAVETVVSRVGYAVVMATETIRTSDGAYVATRSAGVDRFGHELVSGVGETLAHMVTDRLRVKARVCKPGTAQRTSVAHVSCIDRAGARAAGNIVARRLASGQSGAMVTMPPVPLRTGSQVDEWGVWWQGHDAFGAVPLQSVAHAERRLPMAYLGQHRGGLLDPITEAFRDYLGPLVGPPPPPLFRFQ